MGSSSSDSEDYHDSRRRKKKRHQDSSESSSDRERRLKHKKHRRRSHSRSRSSDRYHGSKHSYRRHGRNRSKSRSRSHSRHRSAEHHSRSKSSKSDKKSHSNSRDSSRSKDTRRNQREDSSEKCTTDSSSPVRTGMSAAVKAELKVHKALKAAVDADEILKAQGVVLDTKVHIKSETLSFEDQRKRASAITDIDTGEFTQTSFRSSRSEIPLPSGSAVDASHSGAMFGSVTSTAPPTNVTTNRNGNTVADDHYLMHPNLFVSPAVKMERWKAKLLKLRQQKHDNNV